MWRNVRLVVLVPVAASLSWLLLACSGPQARGIGRPRGAVSPAEVAPPLLTHVAEGRSLRSINSIEIAKPSIAQTAGDSSLGVEDAQQLVERAARETMSLKIVKGAANRAALPTDAVLHTEILRFEERQGSSIGGEPAVVSFKMSLKVGKDGPEVWGAQYFLRQEAVSDNLLRIKERVGKDGLGVGWRSAHDVFQKGVTAALQDFTNRREQQFLTSKG